MVNKCGCGAKCFSEKEHSSEVVPRIIFLLNQAAELSVGEFEMEALLGFFRQCLADKAYGVTGNQVRASKLLRCSRHVFRRTEG